MSYEQNAFVIKVGKRFFARFSPKGRCLIAHCLAGAKLYQPVELKRLKHDRQRIEERGHKTMIAKVRCQ